MDTTNKWFDYLHNTRGLTIDVIREAELSEELGRLRIPIFDEAGNELFAKLRRPVDSEIGPKYTYQRGGKAALYGINFKDLGGPNYLVEGECFDKDAQILTQNGWKLFSEILSSDKVAAVYEKNNVLQTKFEKPLAVVKKHYKGEMYEYSDNNKYYSYTTPEHNLVVYNKYTKKYLKVLAKNLKNIYLIPRVSIYNEKTGCKFTTDEIRFIVMISADFTIRKEGDLCGAFKKIRKVNRFKALCEKLNIPYTCNLVKNNMWSCTISRKFAPKYVVKQFNHDWIAAFSAEQRNAFLDEILYWDGNSVPNRNQIEYSSKYYTNSVFVQTMAHLSGYVSTIIPRQNSIGKWFKVSILFKKQTSSSQNKIPVIKQYDDYVYCVQVTSGMILVRQKDCITVSGNCDALAMRSMGMNAFSSTGGAMTFKPEWLGYLYPGRTNVICFDNDETGVKGSVKVAMIMEVGTFTWVPPVYGKDVSDLVMAVGLHQARNWLTNKERQISFDVRASNQSEVKKVLSNIRAQADALDHSVGRQFLYQLAHEFKQDHQPKKKRKRTQEFDNDLQQAKAYPIENLLHLVNRKHKCLWHNESTASLHLYRDNTLYCHGACNRAYDALDVYMYQNKVTLSEAIKALNSLK